MKQSLTLTLILSFVLSLSSCKKDDENSDSSTSLSVLSEKQKMVGKNFIYSDYNYSIDGVTYSTLNDFPDCQKDDITRFMDNGNYTYDDNSNRCSTTFPQVLTATWSLLNNDTELQLEDESPQKILINDGTTLKLHFIQMADVDQDGDLEENSFTTTYTVQ